MTSKNLRLWSWLVVVALLFGVVGCGATPVPEATQAPAEQATQAPADAPTAAAPETGEEATEVFKLGIQGPFSGPSARTGDEFKAAATMALDAINWQIGKYKIEPIWVDCQSDPAKGAQAYEQAIVQDGMQAGVLNWHSSVAVSLMEIAAKYKIPHFAPYGATEVVNETWLSDPEKYYYWVNKWWPTPEKLTQLYVDALEDAVALGSPSADDKTVAIYGEDTDWGRSFGGAIKRQLEAAGWTTVAEEYFGIDQTEFYPLLNKLKDLDPAVIAGTSTALPSYSALIKQADEVGLESLIVADGLGWFGEWYESTGSSSNYVLDQIPGWATDEGKQFAADFEAANGFPPSPSAAGLAFDGTNFFIEVAKAVYEAEGELTSENLAAFAKDEIQTGNWSYTGGIVMNEYKYTPETVPDPVTGKGY
ncbi:MAG TPA: ABC transporter substrate-binding protein, partial [Anaerolineae bacterium]|nr:ABC transporter substrate-binding protein [Anaerolineae bacterium]